MDPVYRNGLSGVDETEWGDSLKRYRSVLPVMDPSLYRLPLAPTPLVELAPLYGTPVFGKVEGVLPTRSTKDRLVAVALPFMLERGVRRFAFSSTGNTALAYAHGLHMYPELDARLYVSYSVDRETLGPLPPNLSAIVVNGDYATASARVREHASQTGFAPEGGFFNVGRREGAKLAYLEALEELASRGIIVGAVVQAVASGLGIYAAARAIAELSSAGRIARVPRLFCVQQASCAPMVSAYHANGEWEKADHIVRNPNGIAPSILLGDPFASYESVAHAVRDSGGNFVAVEEGEVADVLGLYADRSVPIGASAAVGLAGVSRIVQSWPLEPDEALLVMLTGGPGR